MHTHHTLGVRGVLENFLLRRPGESGGGGASTLVVRPAERSATSACRLKLPRGDDGAARARAACIRFSASRWMAAAAASALPATAAPELPAAHASSEGCESASAVNVNPPREFQ